MIDQKIDRLLQKLTEVTEDIEKLRKTEFWDKYDDKCILLNQVQARCKCTIREFMRSQHDR